MSGSGKRSVVVNSDGDADDINRITQDDCTWQKTRREVTETVRKYYSHDKPQGQEVPRWVITWLKNVIKALSSFLPLLWSFLACWLFPAWVVPSRVQDGCHHSRYHIISQQSPKTEEITSSPFKRKEKLFWKPPCSSQLSLIILLLRMAYTC